MSEQISPEEFMDDPSLTFKQFFKPITDEQTKLLRLIISLIMIDNYNVNDGVYGSVSSKGSVLNFNRSDSIKVKDVVVDDLFYYFSDLRKTKKLFEDLSLGDFEDVYEFSKVVDLRKTIPMFLNNTDFVLNNYTLDYLEYAFVSKEMFSEESEIFKFCELNDFLESNDMNINNGLHNFLNLYNFYKDKEIIEKIQLLDYKRRITNSYSLVQVARLIKDFMFFFKDGALPRKIILELDTIDKFFEVQKVLNNHLSLLKNDDFNVPDEWLVELLDLETIVDELLRKEKINGF